MTGEYRALLCSEGFGCPTYLRDASGLRRFTLEEGFSSLVSEMLNLVELYPENKSWGFLIHRNYADDEPMVKLDLAGSGKDRVHPSLHTNLCQNPVDAMKIYNYTQELQKITKRYYLLMDLPTDPSSAH
jgi:hypothetical protein